MQPTGQSCFNSVLTPLLALVLTRVNPTFRVTNTCCYWAVLGVSTLTPKLITFSEPFEGLRADAYPGPWSPYCGSPRTRCVEWVPTVLPQAGVEPLSTLDRTRTGERRAPIGATTAPSTCSGTRLQMLVLRVSAAARCHPRMRGGVHSPYTH